MTSVMFVAGVILSALAFVMLADWLVEFRARRYHTERRASADATLIRANEIMDRVDSFLQEIGRPLC